MIYLDLETHPISPGVLAPRPVCVQVAQDEGGVEILPLWEPWAHSVILGVLEAGDTIVGHNIAYDMLVVARHIPGALRLVWDAYAAGRISDTLVRQKLIDIAKGRKRKSYSLEAVAEIHGHTKNADDPWRVKYDTVEGLPIEQWPEEAVAYARHDVEVLREIYQAQGATSPDEARQVRAAWWLQIVGETGIWTDPGRIQALEAREQKEFEADKLTLVAAGLVRRGLRLDKARCDRDRIAWTAGPIDNTRILQYPTYMSHTLQYPRYQRLKKEIDHGRIESDKLKDSRIILGDLERALIRDGVLTEQYSRDNKAARARMAAAGVDRLTETGKISLDLEACQISGDPVLMAYARYGSRQTLLKRIADLWNGTDAPINLRFDPLVSTGRTSCIRGKTVAEGGVTNGFQAQNVPRAPGMRECFRPAPGEVILAIDYAGMELCTWAQVCLWTVRQSRLAEALNAGIDPHLALGAELINLTYAEALGRKKDADVKDARQAAKAGNFGFPGGLGVGGFIAYSASQWGIILTPERAQAIKNQWLTTWPEAGLYFEWIRAGHRWVGREDEKQRTRIRHLRSERMRGGCTYTEACNSYFQGLAADAAKAAGFALVRECELGALKGWRVWNFVHDEFLLRGPAEDVDRALTIAQGIIEKEAQLWIPDVKVRTEATVAARWSKSAELIHGPNGRIIPWSPRSDSPT